jgi:hypothetical protein
VIRPATWLASAVLLAGCASIDPYASAPMAAHLQRTDAAGDCARLLHEVDRRVDAVGVRDAQAPRVPGFPYLRVDRFTASLGDAAAGMRGAAFAAWSELMAAADRQARSAELSNAGEATQAVAIDACRYVLAVADQGEFARLREAAQVPDDYSTAMRVLGLYPLTRLMFAGGIDRWQQSTREDFAMPLAQLPQHGRLLRYAPTGEPPRLAALRSAAFGLPAPPAATLSRWVAQHAPALEVDTATDDDRPGTLRWAGGGEAPIGVDVGEPVAYVGAAQTHFGGRVRLQLVYTFWFPARPAENSLDLLSGRLDGLIWRVTLDEAGAPLVYDTIHPCGCYHLFFPVEALAARPQPATLDEGLFTPQTAPTLGDGERIVLRVASRTHYLQRVTVMPAGEATTMVYALRDAQQLRALPWPAGGSRSAYDAAGFIAGTERLERFLFWPMGIASAGQMRQWGRHATAFVGRRHFDDPGLLDLYFEPRPAGAAVARR